MAGYRHDAATSQTRLTQRRGAAPKPPCISTPPPLHQIIQATVSSTSPSVLHPVLTRFIPTLMVGTARGQARPQPPHARALPTAPPWVSTYKIVLYPSTEDHIECGFITPVWDPDGGQVCRNDAPVETWLSNPRTLFPRSGGG